MRKGVITVTIYQNSAHSQFNYVHFSLYVADTFHINPQLHLLLSDMEEVVLSLNQHAIMDPRVRKLRLVCHLAIFLLQKSISWLKLLLYVN